MNNREDALLLQKLTRTVASKNYEIPSVYSDMFALIRHIEKNNAELAHRASKWLRNESAKAVLNAKVGASGDFYKLYGDILMFDAKVDFDSYMLCLELNRPASERFYQPRRKTLKPIAEALQRLNDNKLDELFLSQPPRTGKTTMLLFFCTWIIGKNGERSNLYSAFSDTITQAFYSGLLEILKDPMTYRWSEIFQNKTIARTSAKDEIIDIDRAKRYPSFTARSLYGTLNGACDCNGFLISDDLIGGIEEALNKDRLKAAWDKVDNNLIPRAKEGAKLLWNGTRWSMHDPIGLRLDVVKNDPHFAHRRIQVINVPALNENDESNFQYDYDTGFSTEFYKARRASFERNGDIASWNAQYMGKPIEREGALFVPEEMRFYNGELPDVEPDRIFFAVDPSFGGGDYCAGPVCYQYGEDIYVHDVIYSADDKRITQPYIAQLVVNNGVKALRLEATKATETYKDGIETELKRLKYKCTITTKAAPTQKSKEMRIFDRAPDIREHFIFRESGKRTKMYELFMQNVFTFKMFGKNKHDDAPDSLSMAADMVGGTTYGIEVFRRPF